MRHGSLFSGIGGFDLAAEWMGWENVFHCEINPFGRKVLNYYWSNAISHEDIKTTDFTTYAGRIDVLSGGFPCQPYSLAGKRKGKADDRHLWPFMLSALKTIQPRWIVGENVHGIINWSGGLVFHEIQTDLEVAGYEVFPFVLPACGTNAPHKRDRVWFIAHASSERIQKHESGVISDSNGDYSSEIRTDGQQSGWIGTISNKRPFANSEFSGLQREDGTQRPVRSESRIREDIPRFEHFPTQSPFCDGNDGLSTRLDGITFRKWRNESIKGAGNAVVPQVVYKIFSAIQEYENQH